MRLGRRLYQRARSTCGARLSQTLGSMSSAPSADGVWTELVAHVMTHGELRCRTGGPARRPARRRAPDLLPLRREGRTYEADPRFAVVDYLRRCHAAGRESRAYEPDSDFAAVLNGRRVRDNFVGLVSFQGDLL